MSISPNERIPEWTMGDRMRKAREVSGHTNQREFAELIGVSHQTVTNAEKGHRSVRKITLNAWAMATGVPVEWLQTGKIPHQDDGPDGGNESHTLPGLDSNQQPAGCLYSLATARSRSARNKLQQAARAYQIAA